MIKSFIINNDVINRFKRLILRTLFSIIFKLKEIKLIYFHAN